MYVYGYILELNIETDEFLTVFENRFGNQKTLKKPFISTILKNNSPKKNEIVIPNWGQIEKWG